MQPISGSYDYEDMDKIEEVIDGDEEGDFAYIIMTISMLFIIAIFTLQRG